MTVVLNRARRTAHAPDCAAVKRGTFLREYVERVPPGYERHSCLEVKDG